MIKKKPKYIQIKQEIIAWIQTRKFTIGDQIPVENELMEIFNASRQTVRQAVSELVYENWLVKEQGRGTFVAIELDDSNQVKPQYSHVIAVVKTQISDYLSPYIIKGIETQLNGQGYSLLVFSTMNDFKLEKEALLTAIEKGVDGIIVEPTRITHANPNLHLYFSIIEKKIPIIMISSSYFELGIPVVTINNEAGLTKCVGHLFQLGHTRIGGIFPSDNWSGKFRLRGYMQTLHRNSLNILPDHLILYDFENRTEAIKQLAQYYASLPIQQRASAFACHNDEIAFLLINDLKELGIDTPRDVSVIGFDNSYLAESCVPKLTTIRHPIMEMGAKAAEMLVQALTNKDQGKAIYSGLSDYTFTPELIIRDSCQTLTL